MKVPGLGKIILILAAAVLPFEVLAATVEGTVKYEGDVPKLAPLKMDADPACVSKHTTPPMSEALVLGDGSTMGNIFVSIKSGLAAKEYPAPKDAVVIDQKGCVYEPHVVGLMPGQPFKFRNSDGILHNVHALPTSNRPFNLAMPATSKESADQSFPKEETEAFRIKCDVHPWMNTWVKVMPHPYYAVTGKDGKFKIENLPAGEYEVEFWHEKLGAKTEKITVAESDSKNVDFTFKRAG